MPRESRIEETTKDDGTTSEKLVLEFSNGALSQLRDLAKFYKIEEDDPAKIVEIAIRSKFKITKSKLELILCRGSFNFIFQL